MIHTRRFLGAAAAGAVGIGLLLPMEAAHAEGPCPTGSGTISLPGDCTLSATWVVPSGSKIDGNGHTITLASGFTGPAIESTAGTFEVAAPTMDVAHVTIDAAGSSSGGGILFNGATGGVHDVRIHGASGTDYGIEVDNTVGADFSKNPLPFNQVKIDQNTSITGYQKAGVYLHGGVIDPLNCPTGCTARFTVLRSTIAAPSAPIGQSASGVLVEDLAHGAIAESHITLSGAEPASATTYRAGVKLDHTLRVEVKRNVFSGTDADFGVAADNTVSPRTTAAVDCNLFRRTAPSGTDPFGVAVGRFNTDKTVVNVVLTNTTFQGSWKRDSGTVSGTTVTAGVPNDVRTTTSNCRPGAPGNVLAKGGNGQSKVTWAAAKAPGAWAPLTGYKVTAKTAGRPAVVKNVGPTARSAMLTGLKNGHTYKVTVAAESNGGSTKGTDTLYPTKLSLSGPKAIRHGTRAHLGGKLSSSDRNAKLSKRKLQLWAKPKGGKWSRIGTIKTQGGGHFDTTVKPRKKTTYKVVYGGHPGLASSHKFTVRVR